MTHLQARNALGIIIIGFVAIALLYVRAVPIFENSDEAEHTLHAHTILETGQLPVIQSREEMAQKSDPVQRWNNQSHHAPLYYLAAAGLTSWTQRDDIRDYLRANELIFLRNTVENNPNKWLQLPGTPAGDTHLAVYTLRLLSIVIGAGTLLLIHHAAAYIFDERLFQLSVTAFVAFLPTFIVVNSSVSNDAPVIFLYTAGILWALRVLDQERITLRDALLMGGIMGGIALTKLTGLSLMGIVVLTLFVGIWRGYWTLRQALRHFMMITLVLALLAGWWYLRNFQLYGDFLALDATASIWGREAAFTADILLDNLARIWRSFWLLIGYLHNPVLAPPPFYSYAGLIVSAGGLGIIRHILTSKRGKGRDTLMILLAACALVTFMLLWGTRSVDISYGRLLLPAIIGFAGLMMLGWRALVGRFASLLSLPLLALALYTPLAIVPRVYPSLEIAPTIPASAIPVAWQADALEIVALDMTAPDVVRPNAIITLDLYVRGNHPDNPALLVTVADSLRAVRLGHVEIYPGRAPTDGLDENTLYRVPVRVPLDQLPEAVAMPRLTTVLVEFVNLEDDRAILFDSGESLLEVFGATFYDERYQAQEPGTNVDVRFGDVITLSGYSVPQTAQAGETLALQFNWLPAQAITEDWILSLQLFNETGERVAQSDGMPYWYPTSAWVEGVPFSDARQIALPDDLPAGDYRLQVAWYQQRDDGTFQRLPVKDGSNQRDYFAMQLAITNN